MAARADLELRAASANVDWTLLKYQNDSVLEQAVIYAEQQRTATSTATTKAPSVNALRVHGGKNL